MNAFFALQPRWLGRDQFYKIYVTAQDLRGALIGRQVYDEDSAYRQMIAAAQIFAPLMKVWANRILRRVRLREADYDSIVLSSDVFLRHNRLNFLIGRGEILDVKSDTKKRLWTGYSQIAGTLRLQLHDHSEREWIITGNQDIDAITNSLGFPRVNQAVHRTRGSSTKSVSIGVHPWLNSRNSCQPPSLRFRHSFPGLDDPSRLG
jgi:hypothetical protein